MKNDVTGKPLGTNLEKLRALTDEDITLDDDTPYDPNDPAAVEAFWKNAVVTPGGGVQATLARVAPGARTGAETAQNSVDGTLFAAGSRHCRSEELRACASGSRNRSSRERKEYRNRLMLR